MPFQTVWIVVVIAVHAGEEIADGGYHGREGVADRLPNGREKSRMAPQMNAAGGL